MVPENGKEERFSPMAWVKAVSWSVKDIGIGSIVVLVFLGMWTGYMPSIFVEQHRNILETQTEILIELKEITSVLTLHHLGTDNIAKVQRAICINGSVGEIERQRCYEGVE